MERIFLSFHFDDAGKALADSVERLIRSHGILAVTGERLDGELLSDGVKNRIKECDAVVSLLTERDEGRADRWVVEERAYADGLGKWIAAVVQEGLEVGGMYQQNERIKFKPDAPQQCFLEISELLGSWKRKSGRFIRIQIEPQAAAALAAGDENATVRYRFWERDRCTDWQETRAVPRAGGVIVYLKGATEEVEVQVEVVCGRTIWRSEVEPQTLRLALTEVG